MIWRERCKQSTKDINKQKETTSSEKRAFFKEKRLNFSSGDGCLGQPERFRLYNGCVIPRRTSIPSGIFRVLNTVVLRSTLRKLGL